MKILFWEWVDLAILYRMDRFSGQNLEYETSFSRNFFNEKKLEVTLPNQLFSGIPGKLKKQKRRAAQFGAGCTNFQLEISDFGPVRKVFVIWESQQA